MFRKKQRTEDVGASELRRMLQECPACKGSLHAHQFVDFAITIASNETKTQLLDFFRALKKHDWRAAKRFQDFDPRYNAAIAKVLRCVSGSIVLLIIRDPEELWESSNIEDYEVLSPEIGRALEAEIESSQWRTI